MRAVVIYFLVTRGHAYTIGEFMPTWGKSLAQRLCVVYWEDLVRWRRLPLGTYVFSDLERLGPAMMDFARHVAGRLDTAGGGTRLVNDPRRVKLRYDLLRTLHEDQTNPFRGWRPAELTDGSAPVNFPVFLRHESEHDGSLSPLLPDWQALRATLKDHGPGDLLAVEYFETRDAAGKFWKHAAFRVGQSVFPHHIISNGNWVTKAPSDLCARRYERENEWVRTRPHDAAIRRIFETAGIEYGRIDYGVCPDGRIVAWEINTNPMVLMMPCDIACERLQARFQVWKWLLEGFEELDIPPEEAPARSWIQTGLPAELRRRLGLGMVRRSREGAAGLLRKSADWLEG